MTNVSFFDEQAPQAKPTLRVVQDAETETLEALTRKVELLEADLELAEAEIKQRRRTEKSLKTRIRNLLRDDVDYDEAWDLVKWWQQCSGERAVFDQRCQEKVMKAIKILERHYKDERDPHEMAVRHIAAAFLGICRRGFIDPQTRERRNRIGLVVADGESLMKYLKLYYVYCRETGVTPVKLPAATLPPEGVDPVTGEIL